MSRRVLSLCALVLGGAFSACSADHSALEKKAGSGRGGQGAGGTSGLGGTFPQIGGVGGASANGGHADDEPPGTSVLTVVNGVVDAPRIALCFAKVDVDGNVTPFGDPLGNAPLEYGQALALHDIAGADLGHDTLQPAVIAGELNLTGGLDCEAAIERARSEEALDAASDGSAGSGSVGGETGTGGDASNSDTGSGGAEATSGGVSAAGEGGPLSREARAAASVLPRSKCVRGFASAACRRFRLEP